jgi:hypothetical protein
MNRTDTEGGAGPVCEKEADGTFFTKTTRFLSLTNVHSLYIPTGTTLEITRSAPNDARDLNPSLAVAIETRECLTCPWSVSKAEKIPKALGWRDHRFRNPSPFSDFF